jgi:hypothetical protein
MKIAPSWSGVLLAVCMTCRFSFAQDAPAAAQTPANPSPPAATTQPATRNAPDRLDLDTTVVIGNRELPKVLYIVPWKKADLGDLPGQPFNSLLDEALTPIDRDVFRREVTYYDAVAKGRQSGNSSASSARSAGEAQ